MTLEQEIIAAIHYDPDTGVFKWRAVRKEAEHAYTNA